ncbi:MAG: penicillin-binding protein, partial [Proteobacteria bacterium]|nr:penicillin-binding protein [Pseudomonadota bacterium]
MEKPKQPKPPQPESNPEVREKPKVFDPREQAIKYKAYRHIFSDKDVKKGLDEKAIIRKIKKSKSLSGRYRQYLEMRDDNTRGNQTYPWQNPFNRSLFWSAYWIPRFLKWGTLLSLALFILNYIPGPTQHIIEVLIARSIYDTAPVERLPDDLETYAHSADIKDSRGAIIKSYGKRKVTQQLPASAQKALLACEDHYF